MRKIIRRTILTICTIAILLVGSLALYGHHQYKKISQQADITYLVSLVQEQENFVPYDELSPNLVNATVAIEDKRYFNHSGVDYIGLIRALMSQFNSNFLRSGGSTITQQTAKNLYQQFNASFFDWKTAEFYFALELERHYTKEEIFAIYVNIINYGDNNTGIYEAAMDEFGVTPSELTLAQASILAGIPQSPSNYQLSTNYSAAKQRQKLVLSAMAEQGYISEQEADQAYTIDVQ